jgi:DNA-binding MarR family transcriptional regulator
MGITMSTTSGLVGKLVDRGLVARGSNSDDRRQIPLELTEAGLQLAGELAGYARPFLDRVSAELGDDLERVVSALEVLTEAAERARAR